MTNHEEWHEFLWHLLSNAEENYQRTKEYSCVKEQQERLGEMLTTNFTLGEKAIREDALFELGEYAHRETEVMYKQGMKDCVWLLKNLGVLA